MNREIVTTEQVKALETIAEYAATSKFFEKLGGKAGLFCIGMYAQELGLPPLQCLFGGMNNIQGKIELSPRLMNSMIRKAGHKVEVLECDLTHCKLRGTRSDTNEALVVNYSIDDAKRAGIFRSGGPWEKFPDDMCFKSALSKLARRLFADIISTAYIEGEIVEERSQKPRETIEEAIPIVEDPITPQEVQAIESAILEFDDAVEYRKRLLAFCVKKHGPMADFSKVPKSGLEAVWNGINRKKAKETKTQEPEEVAVEA